MSPIIGILIESLAKSPETSRVLARRGLVLSKDKAEENEVNRTIVDSIKESCSVLKSSTGNGTMRQKAGTIYRARIKMATLKSKSKKAIGKVSKLLELRRKAIVSNVLKSFEAYKLDDKAIEAIRKFWHKKSRPTGDKRDIIRKRTDVKCYEEHPRQILEKKLKQNYTLTFVKKNHH